MKTARNKNTYWILSGEGTTGTWSKHITTPHGIKCIAARMRCGGDRWVQAWLELRETKSMGPCILSLHSGDVRHIPEVSTC